MDKDSMLDLLMLVAKSCGTTARWGHYHELYNDGFVIIQGDGLMAKVFANGTVVGPTSDDLRG